MKKILTVVGARPQFVKAAVLTRAFRKHAGLREIMVHTGQHYDDNMSGRFFRELDIPSPAYHLNAAHDDINIAMQQMLRGLAGVIQQEQPDLMVVYGDTNSTLSGALSAQWNAIPLAHIEAGLRSYIPDQPEERNRILTDHSSTLLFCPTRASVNNLKKENAEAFGRSIYFSGDVMYDSLLFTLGRKPGVENPDVSRKEQVFCTIHRSENTDNHQRLALLLEIIDEVHKTIPVVLALHPRTALAMKKSGLSTRAAVSPPLSYFETLKTIRESGLVMTDSGGLQKEAYFLQTPCVTLRKVTEWVELVEAGANMLAGDSKESALQAFSSMYEKKIVADPGLYGDGHAGDHIAGIISKFLTGK